MVNTDLFFLNYVSGLNFHIVNISATNESTIKCPIVGAVKSLGVRPNYGYAKSELFCECHQ